jgi:hypothetical protein
MAPAHLLPALAPIHGLSDSACRVASPKSHQPLLPLLDMQVWNAVESWRSLKKAQEVAAAGEAGMAAERAQEAALIGADVSKRERLPEEVRIAKRVSLCVF